MSRPRKCKICNADLPTTGRVNSMLEARVKLKTIAAEIPQFSVSQLSKHRNRCRAPHSTVELAPDAGSDEHRVWAQRCTDAYHLAILNGDSRSAIAACSAATRQLVALAKKLEKERETEPADDPNALTIENLDAAVKDFAARAEQERGVCIYCGLSKNRREQHELIAD